MQFAKMVYYCAGCRRPRSILKPCSMKEFINVSGAIKDLKDLKKQLNPTQVSLAISRGINKTLLKGRTEARKAVKVVYDIPQKNIAEIDIKRATKSLLMGYVYAPTKPVPLNAFNPKYSTPTKSIRVTKKGVQRIKDKRRRNNAPGAGVSVQIKKGTTDIVPYAFMIPGAKPHVFARGRYADSRVMKFNRRFKRENNTGADVHVNALMSITTHQAVVNPAALSTIKKRVQEDFPKDLKHEVEFLVSKVRGGTRG